MTETIPGSHLWFLWAHEKLVELEEKLYVLAEAQARLDVNQMIQRERLEELWARCDLQFPQFARWHIEDMEKLDNLEKDLWAHRHQFGPKVEDKVSPPFVY